MAAIRHSLRLLTAMILVLAGTVSSSFAETLMMPKRDALKGTPIVVWGVTTLANHTAGTPTTYQFDFGDNTQTALTNMTDRSYIAVTHSYTGNQGTYTATLTVTRGTVTETAQAEIQVFDPKPANTADTVRSIKINMAIADGLRWLWTMQGGSAAGRQAGFGGAANPPGTTTSWLNTSYSALVVLAFENHGYRLPNDNTMPTGLYEKYIVRRGMIFIVQNLTTIANMGPQPAGHPCVGIPGEPVQPANTCTGLMLNESAGYSTGIAMMPLAGSAALNRQSTETTGFTQNKTYREILQRLTNGLAWGQTDPASGVHRGGWRYGFGSGNSGAFDGSTVGWAVLALLDAAAVGITIPSFVKSEFTFGFNNAYNNDGTLDYVADGAAANSQPSTARAGVGIQGLFYLGTVAPFAPGSKGDRGLQFISSRWNAVINDCGANPQQRLRIWHVQRLQGLETAGRCDAAGRHPPRRSWCTARRRLVR